MNDKEPDLWRFGDAVIDTNRVMLAFEDKVVMTDGREYCIGKEAVEAFIENTARPGEEAE